MTLAAPAARSAAPFPVAPGFAATARSILVAAALILPDLERGRAIDARALRSAMETAFGGSDADGAWDWKTAYDACEAAQVLFLRKYGGTILRKSASPLAALAMIEKVATLLPTHTRRSETSQAFQQFSTPAGLGFVATVAAAIRPGDVMLEPSAGTGLLAVQAETRGAGLVLNELAEIRAEMLAGLFADCAVTRHDAAHIHDYLRADIVPSVVVMNPPFSAVAHVDRTMKDAALRHIGSALARLAEGGRLVAITGASCAPDNPAWTDAFAELQERGRVLFSAAIDGQVYAKHGTTIDTRLIVLERVPADDPRRFPASPGVAPDTATLLGWVQDHVPPRGSGPDTPPPAMPVAMRAMAATPAPRRRAAPAPAPTPVDLPEAAELAYEAIDWTPAEAGRLTDAIYEPYALQSLRIDGAKPHPTPLVQSAAMASVSPPRPSYRPVLPASLVADSILSDAQLESVILAGEAHAGHLAGAWTVDGAWDVVTAAPDDAENAVRFRRGWFLGDGTGAGKGRQVAGIILDNWLKGRRRAVGEPFRDPSSGRHARLGSARPGAPLGDAAVPLPAGHGDHAGRGRAVHHLRHPAFAGAWREGEPRPADRRLAGRGLRRCDRVRRGARDGERGRRHQRARRAGALAAGPRRASAPARAARCPRRLCLRHRRDHRAESRLRPAPRPVGRRGFPVRHAQRVHRGD
jgi:predicted RNA methylase